jgi:SAM-dependent methyltransferase
MDTENIRGFWRDKHDPQRYLRANPARTAALVDAVQVLKLDSPAILEIGCNSGRNLFGLWDAGYRDLTGIEINLSAIRLMREARPDCTIAAIPHAVEDIIQQLPSRHFDLVFTMAVLLHLPPASEWVFAEMVRISAHYLITIECETSRLKTADMVQRHWRRNYRTVFEALGMRQLDVQNGPGDLSKYVLRVFERK